MDGKAATEFYCACKHSPSVSRESRLPVFDHRRVPSLTFISSAFLLSKPRSYSPNPVPGPACSTTPFLNSDLYCTGECNTECFPRVRDICFASDKVRLCQATRASAKLPKFMRFFGETLTIPVERDSHCNEGWHWVQGFSLVLDQRFLPAGKPNPHHEAEKLIPALLLKEFINKTANVQWFAAQSDVSVWGKGLLTALGLPVRFHTLPVHKDDSICFKDAVLFSGPTHVKYVPDEATNSWLRSQVLNYCKIEERNASWPITRAVVLDRSAGPRKLANKLDAGKVMERTLVVPWSIGRVELAASASRCGLWQRMTCSWFRMDHRT